jgi:serine-threonine kinase receptor-associated protein
MFVYIWEQDTHLLLTGGAEKILRIYDLNRPDAPPKEVDKSPGSVRSVAWLHSDQTILSSCTDMGGVRYNLLDHTMLTVGRCCRFCI